MSQPTLIIADDHPLFRAARIVKVWVLPKAKEGKLDRTFPARRFDEMSRQAREHMRLMYESTRSRHPVRKKR